MIPFFDQFVLFFKNLSYLCSVIGEKSNDEGSFFALTLEPKNAKSLGELTATNAPLVLYIYGLFVPSYMALAGNVGSQFFPKGDWRCPGSEVE